MRRKYYPLLVFSLCFVVLALFFPEQIFKANDTYFGFKEDGLKNYYVMDYHQRYDSSATYFGGLNYPFGEHIVFTDGQPVLNYVLWGLKKVFPFLASYTVGIINLLMLLGICWSAVLMFKIFRHFGVNDQLAIPAALFLSWMAPQLMRITLHYALAYSFFIPWVIYRLILFAEDPSWKRSVAVALLMFLSVGLHLYYLLIIGFLIGVFYLLLVLQAQKRLSFGKMLFHLGVQVVLPLLTFMLWIKITDAVNDRPSSPWGMMEYRAMWEGVFLPLEMPAGEWLKSVVNIRSVSFEAIAYVGLPATIFFLFCLVLVFVKKYRLKFMVRGEITWLLFLSAFLVFLFAAAFPFLFEFPLVASLSGPLKQFRSLGRLSWVLFYGLNIFLIVFLSGRLKDGKPVYKYLAIMVVFLMALESSSFLYGISKRSGYARKHYIVPAYTIQDKVSILPAPYFHNGSENLGTSPDKQYLAERTMELSIQTGLPSHAVLLSRTSLHQTLQQLEMVMNLSGPLMASADRWMLLEDTAYRSPAMELLRPLRKDMQVQAPYLVSMVSVEEVNERIEARAREYRKQLRVTSNNSAFKEHNGFDKGGCEGLVGSGMCLKMDRSHVLYRNEAYEGSDSVSFVFWLKAGGDGLRGYKLVFKQENAGVKDKHYRLEWCYTNVVKGYIRLEIKEKPVKGKACSLELQYDRQDLLPETVIDEWIVTVPGADFVYERGHTIFTNKLVYY